MLKDTSQGASSTIQEKIEKKPSTAARVARGLGLKRTEKDSAKVSSPTNTTPSSTTTTTLNGTRNIFL